MSIPAVPGVYRGVLFRSNLERQWARAFDGMLGEARGGPRWIYEPPPHRPDFELFDTDGKPWIIVEIKNDAFDIEHSPVHRFTSIAKKTGRSVFLLAGNCWPGQYSVFVFSADGARIINEGAWRECRGCGYVSIFGIGGKCRNCIGIEVDAFTDRIVEAFDAASKLRART